jgi:uncharacterized HAD superfamily protein
MTRIALDLESTLADINALFRDQYAKKHDYRPGEWTEWDFTDVEFDVREFMKITGSNWKNLWHKIPAEEQKLDRTAYELYREADTVDIVTARLGHTDQIKDWLRYHGVVFDELVQTGKAKHNHDYDVYIDDKPALARDATDEVFLIDQPYNRGVDANELPNVTRINKVREVATILREHQPES